MPTQEVARAAQPSALVRRSERSPQPVLLDGGGPDSWGDGRIVYADRPRATLEVFASGWARWRGRDGERWRWGCPLAQWQAFLDIARSAHPGTGAAAGGGVLTVLSYELKHWIERLPRRLPWPRQPVLYGAWYDWNYRACHRTGRAWIAAATHAQLTERLRWYEEAVCRPAGGTDCTPAPRCPRPAWPRDEYLHAVARAQAYIAAGDVYQVNLAQPFTTLLPRAAAADLFAAWVTRYPMPFAAYVDGGGWTAVSNSPECFLLVDGDRVATFPIKGTRRCPRGDGAAPAADLLGDAKERAEHVMIVDLERNDLGRVCAIGSVAVADFTAARRYPGLLHLVSEVRGRLRPETPLAALVRATFPGGSITGAPKVRAMEIIEELEPCARGVYTGAIGWTDLDDGTSRFNLAIRTALLTDAGLTYHAGGGIVADSEPAAEYTETLVKSETLFRALGRLGRS